MTATVYVESLFTTPVLLFWDNHKWEKLDLTGMAASVARVKQTP